MPWFRVDDNLDQHPKADAAGNKALGLWVRAGSYSARLLTEGFIPKAQVARLGGSPADAARLVEAGLWEAAPGGYRFHEWEERQPTKVQVEADRAAAAERQRRAREKAKAAAEAKRAIESREESRRDNPEPSRGESRRESRSPRPGPARPGKNLLLTLVSRLAAGEVGPPPAEVIDAWQLEAGPDVDLEAEAAAYLIRYGDRPAKDERSAWIGWLRAAKKRADAARPAPAKPPCPRPDCHGGWLDSGDNDTPAPCPECKPHLRPVAREEAS